MTPGPTVPRRGSQQSTPVDDLITRIHSAALETPTTLLSSLRVGKDPTSRTAADGSTSDSDTQSPSPTKTKPSRPGHSRSLSHPFPSLFGSKRRTQSSVGQAAPPQSLREDEDKMSRSEWSTQRNPGGRSGSVDFMNGNCMTCATLVRWPKDLPVFKCTICATINDLGPAKLKAQSKGSQNHRRGASQGLPSSARLTPLKGQASQSLSLEHSKDLVRQCLRSYMLLKLCDKKPTQGEQPPLAETRPPPPSRAQGGSAPSTVTSSTASQVGKRSSFVSPEYVSQRIFAEAPTLRPNPLRQNPSIMRSYSSSHSERPSFERPMLAANQGVQGRRPSAPRDDGPKLVFKPLEDYILSCFTSMDCISSSFMLHGFRHSTRPSREAFPRKTLPVRESRTPRFPREASVESAQTDVAVCELDPKLLLLGDVAENGTWWTGAPADFKPTATASHQSENGGAILATTKSPQFNWDDLTTWYSVVVNAAEGWFDLYGEISQEPEFVRPTQQDLQKLERDLLKAQEHLQRTLMKAIEVLLKRPGRSISEPSHLRFLLIMLENPLLDPGHMPFQGLIQEEDDYFTNGGSVSPREKYLKLKSGFLSGRHSGIIKRIVGLISNSSDECHHQLIIWLAGYQTQRFIQVKELISGFLTYRMLRQGDREAEIEVDVTAGLIPQMQAGRSGAYLHDEIGSSSSTKKTKESSMKVLYTEDWQIKAASRVLALVFAANNLSGPRKSQDASSPTNEPSPVAAIDYAHGSPVFSTSDFYNSMIDYIDLVGDFESWESKRGKFAFCQYPFLLSIWAKKIILEYDARRQMQNKARDAFFDSIMTRRNVNQFFVLDVRRDCLVDDSLQAVSEVIGSGSEDVKKSLRVTFRGEEGIDGGGLRKEWFLLLVREVFNPDHGLYIYDEDSQYCFFNPNSFETSDQFFLVGVVMGLAIYNSTILDVALPPFAFRKLLAAAPAHGLGPSAHPRPVMRYTLDDLAEYRPRLAQGLRQLLEYDGNVEETFCLDFVIDVDKYDTTVQVPLCKGGEQKAVTNSNRREFVDLYVRYVLDTAVTRQFEPFKRGFYTICGGNAFSLFRPEEVELLVRGSDEALDIDTLRGVAEYVNWGNQTPDGEEHVIGWFWDTFKQAAPSDQRKMLLFITGSDRIPAIGAAVLPIKISCLGDDCGRYPIARTCFNQLSLWRYESKERLETMLWRAVKESEGFGLK